LDSSSNYNNLTGNNCTGNFYGILLDWYSSNNNLTGNNCSGNSYYGIYLESSNSNNLTGNNCSSNSYYGIYFGYSSSNTLTGNNCSSNSYGIRLYSSSSNNLTGNNCTDNSEGIDLDYSSSNNLTYNNFSSNTQHAIYITGSSTGNLIHHNNFWQNNGSGTNCQAYDDSGGNNWNLSNPQEGNYWDNWDGQDWGTASAYPIDGGAGAADWYPIPEYKDFLLPAVFVAAIGMLGFWRRRRGQEGKREPEPELKARMNSMARE